MNELIHTVIELYKAHPVAQSIGFFGMVAALLGYQGKSTRQILHRLSASSALWLLHFAFLGATAGAILNGIAIPRNLIFARRDTDRWADSIAWPIVFSLIYIAAGAWSWFGQGEGPISVLSTSAQMLGTFALRMKNARAVRWLSIPVSLLWLVYDMVSGSIPGTLNEIFCQISLYVAIFRYRERA